MVKLLLILVLLALPVSAQAQTGSIKSAATIATEVNVLWPNNTTGLITPTNARQTLLDMISSAIFGPSSGVVTSLDIPVFSGTLGTTLSDSGIAMAAMALIATNNVYTGINTFAGLRVAVRTAIATTDTITTADYFVCADNASSAAAENLPAAPVTGQTFLIKDCGGNAATHNITVTPAAGNIDGSSTFVMSTAYQSSAVTYNGTQWSLN